ncbi:hypothetical protein N7492_004585 [Penicillium capsulatum]|uniref:Telomere replication protein EST3 n=1 Tax=Penicillium capsulatum TaxID=69766 RepID=A0A9W9IE64_9EURO|nr:hypothetical protein N7492_004585 [Penicillium capsulatum]KAJ6136298.1 hypothetical protein N7512_001458 [Penicillium capsulatum]
MDRGNQINATLTPESLAASNLPSGGVQSDRNGPKKHRIELLDFCLVLTYSTPAPEVHLHVDRFRIDWDKGLTRYVPSKKVQKVESISSLLVSTYQAVKSSQVRGFSGTKKHTRASGSLLENDAMLEGAQGIHLGQNASQHFTSQLPVQEDRALERNSNAAYPQLHTSADLLQRLAQCSPLASGESTRQYHKPMPPSKSNEMQSAKRQPSPLQNVNENRREDSVLSQPRNEAFLEENDVLSTQVHYPEADIAAFETQPSSKCLVNPLGEHSGPSGYLTKKRRRESSAGIYSLGHDASNSDFPSQKRHRAAGNDAAVDSNSNSMHGDIPITVNPWAGLTRIAENDVVIPNDQIELLENSEMLWLPPNPGQQMPQGHVPPSLLRQWNKIAEQRHRLLGAQENRLVSTGIGIGSERPITPTQDTMETCGSSPSQETPSQWSASPASHFARTPNRLPDSSPVKQRSLTSRDQSRSQSPIKRHATQRKRTDSKDYMPVTQGGLPRNNEPSAHTTNPLGELSTQAPLAPGEAKTRRGSSVSLNRVQHEQPPEGDTMLGNNDIKRSIVNHVPSSDIAMVKEPPSHPPSPRYDVGQEDDSDDDSMMDASVPVALGEILPDPSQPSQAEHEITCPGSSLSGMLREDVQINETPMAGNKGLHQDGLVQEQQQSSFQAHRSSSQSRVPDTFPTRGSLDKSKSSQGTSNASEQSQESRASKVDVPGTQPHSASINSNSQSQSGSHHSQSEIVLDSSGPAHRHEYPSHAIFEPLTHDFAISHQPFSSQANESAPDSPAGRPSPGDISSYIPVTDVDQSPSKGSKLLPPAAPRQFLAFQSNELPKDSQIACASPDDAVGSAPAGNPGQSPAQNPRRLSGEDDATGPGRLRAPPASLVPRLGSAKELEGLSEAQKAFKKFRSYYPVYTGDFEHFAELCSKLQALRAQGELQDSTLWDDFIIMHIQRYLPHCQTRAPHDCPSYEVFFTLKFSQPSCRKRSLTARDIDHVTSQHAPAVPSPITRPSNSSTTFGVQGQHPELSFTASLTEKFTDLNAHSFGDEYQNERLGSDEQTEPDVADLPRSPSVEVKQEATESDPDEAPPNCAHHAGFFPDSLVSSVESTMDQKLDPRTYDTDQARGQTEAHISEVEETDTENVWCPSDEDSNGEDHCRTASVELGDETFVSTNAQSQTKATPEKPVEPDSEDDNWFISFRRRQVPSRTSSAGDRWYDDRNTPFKSWAIADQNVLSERYRRGGAPILVNERGEIRRPIQR